MSNERAVMLAKEVRDILLAKGRLRKDGKYIYVDNNIILEGDLDVNHILVRVRIHHEWLSEHVESFEYICTDEDELGVIISFRNDFKDWPIGRWIKYVNIIVTA